MGFGGRVCRVRCSRCLQSCSDGREPAPTLPASVEGRGETSGSSMTGVGERAGISGPCMLNALEHSAAWSEALCARAWEMETRPSCPQEGRAWDTHSYRGWQPRVSAAEGTSTAKLLCGQPRKASWRRQHLMC